MISGFYIKDYMLGNGLRLQGCELLLFAIISSFSTQGAVMFCSERYLAEFLGYRRECVSRAMASLMEKNLVMRSSRKHQPGNTYCYRINDPEVFRILDALDLKDMCVTFSHTALCKKVTHGSEKKSHGKHNRKENKIVFIEKDNDNDSGTREDGLDDDGRAKVFHGSTRI